MSELAVFAVIAFLAVFVFLESGKTGELEPAGPPTPGIMLYTLEEKYSKLS